MGGRLRILGALMAIALVGVACGGSNGGSSNESPASTVKEGGTLRVGTSSTIDSLNPFVAFQANAILVFTYQYPWLTQYDAHNNIVGSFAKSWSTSSDGLTWTFHTRPDAEWSDGKPLTANDAAWTISTILKFAKGPTANLAGDVAHLKTATAPDPNTLVLHYSVPVANVLPNLQVVPILPEHVWAPIAGSDGKKLRTYPNLPVDGQPVVGGGAFVLSQYKKNEVALFTRNPHWYGAKPNIDQFGLEFFSDADAMVAAMKSGNIDAIASPQGIPPTSVKTLQVSGIHVYQGPSLTWPDFIINANTHKTQHRELLDPLVREAFEYAVDRDAIVKTAYLGYAQPGASIIPPSTGAWHDPSVQPLPFDLAKAAQLLDQAGDTMGPNGVRMADGHPMSYTVIFASDESGPGDRAFQIIQQDYAKIGVRLTQKTQDADAATLSMYGPNYTSYPFDVAMWGWITLLDPDYMLAVPTCAQWGVLNDSGYCNKTYDNLYQQQSTTLDHAARVKVIDQMQQQIYNDRPYIILTYDDWTEANNPKWEGFVMSPDGSFNALSIATMLGVHQVK